MRTSPPKSKAELVSHPDRLRILNVLAGKRMTPKQIGEELPNIAQATLYRQIAVLLEGGIIEVVEKRQAHGAVESTYALKKGASHLTREEFACIPKEEHEQNYAVLAANTGIALSSYFSQPEYDTTADGTTYFGATLVLTDAQARKLRLDLIALFKSYVGTPKRGARRRKAFVAIIPDPKK